MNFSAMKPPVFLTALLSLALAACEAAAPDPGPPPLEGASIGGPFTLQSADGRQVSWDDFAGRWRVVYFGYAFCPDVCPVDVGRTTRAIELYAQDHPERAEALAPIFVTVDPERDTPAVLAEFRDAFSDQWTMLRGTPEETKEVATSFGVSYSRGQESEGGGYLVGHSNYTTLFDADGAPVAMLPTDEGAEAVAAELAKWVR